MMIIFFSMLIGCIIGGITGYIACAVLSQNDRTDTISNEEIKEVIDIAYEKKYNDICRGINKVREEIDIEKQIESNNHDSFDEYSEGRYDAFNLCLRSIDRNIDINNKEERKN